MDFDLSRRLFIKLSTLFAADAPEILRLIENKQQNTTISQVDIEHYIYVNHENLFHLEFFIYGGKVVNNKLVGLTSPPTLLIKIPPLHKSESPLSGQIKPSDITMSISSIASSSWLVFDVKTGMPFTIKELLKWNDSRYMKLRCVDKQSRFFISPTKSIPWITDQQSRPVTTLEVPKGLYISPYTENNKPIIFSNNNDSHLLNRGMSFLDLIGQIEVQYRQLYNNQILDRNRYIPRQLRQHGIVSTYQLPSNAYPIWNNSLIQQIDKSRDTSPKFKIIGSVNDTIDDRISSLPSRKNKYDLVKQFREDPNNSEFVDTTSLRAMITGLGAYTKLEYQTKKRDARISKWAQEIILGRDQKIEIEYPGSCFPFGHSMAEVEIIERVNIDGVSILKRKTVLKTLDSLAYYRSKSDQSNKSVEDKLNSILYASDRFEQDQLHSLKRSSPFSEIRIVTEISEPIENSDTEFQKIIQKEEPNVAKIDANIQNLLKSNIDGSWSAIKNLVSVLRPNIENILNNESINAPDWFLKLVKDETEVSISSDTIKIDRNNYLDYVEYIHDYKKFLREIINFNTISEENRNLISDSSNICDKLINEIHNKVTKPILSLYYSTSELSVQLIKNKFSSIVQEIAKLSDSGKVPECLSNFHKYCNDTEASLIRNPSEKRKILDSLINVILGSCINILENNINVSEKIKNKFNEQVAAIRSISTSIVACSHTEIINSNKHVLAYWPRLASKNIAATNKEVLFDFIGVDWDGNEVAFKAPFIFVRSEMQRQVVGLQTQAEKYLGALDLPGDKLKLNDTKKFLQSTAIELDKYVNTHSANLQESLNAGSSELDRFRQNFLAYSKLNELYQKVTGTVNKTLELDSAIMESYQSPINKPLRQIGLNDQTIAFYKSEIDTASSSAEEGISKLKTRFMEFTAAGSAELTMLRSQLIPEGQELYESALLEKTHFFPKLSVASVQLPIQKEFSDDGRSILLSYSDAFIKAGAEIIHHEEVQQNPILAKLYDIQGAGRANKERILFDVQKYSYISQKTRKDIESDILINIANSQLLTAQLESIASNNYVQLREYLEKTRSLTKDVIHNKYQEVNSFVAGEMRGLLSSAGSLTGNLIDPSPVCKVLSLSKNTYYMTKALVNEIDGTIKNSIKEVEGVGQQKVHEFTESAKAEVLNIFSEISIFGLRLSDIINKDALSPQILPETRITKVYKKSSSGLELPVAVQMAYKWNPARPIFKKDDTSPFRWGTSKTQQDAPTISIDINSTLPLNTNEKSEIKSEIKIGNFGIAIQIGTADLIVLYFEKIVLEKKTLFSGQSTSSATNVDFRIANVEFDHYLSLVKQLQDLLGLKGFLMDLRSDGIQLSIGITIPPISTGPFTIANAALFAGVLIPFKSGETPSVRFSFSERANPFTLAAGIFGGRGFIALEATAMGMKKFEASLEFGGYLGLNFGVASGQAYLMAGIYFRIRDNRPYVEAYIVCGGNLSIIGIINVSVVFYLGMGYMNGVLTGRCSVTVSVSVLFWSASYTLSFEKTIGGNNASITGLIAPGLDTLLASSKNEPTIGISPKHDAPYGFRNSKNSEPIPVYDPSLLFSYNISKDDAIKYASFF